MTKSTKNAYLLVRSMKFARSHRCPSLFEFLKILQQVVSSEQCKIIDLPPLEDAVVGESLAIILIAQFVKISKEKE
jgi:hypothetical protein